MCTGTHPFIPAPATLRFQLIYTLDSQRIENVLHVKSGAGTVAADLDRVKGVLAAWWNASGRAQVANNVSLVLMVADAINAPGGVHQEYSTGWGQPGSEGTNSYPGAVTMAVKLSTGLSGRSNRGRIFWPGMPSRQIINGVVQSPFIVNVIAALAALQTSLAVGGDTLAVVSYCHNGVWRTTAAVNPVTAFSIRSTVCQQIRRRVAGT